MSGRPRPILVVSRCLGFDACRWDGGIVWDPFVEALSHHVEPLTVCPEVGIGLGVPRDPILVERRNGELRLVQPDTGRDLTAEMKVFCRTFLASLREVDGFLLKARSPSCGIGDVKIYPPGRGEKRVVGKGSGFFGAEVARSFPLFPAESESRLQDLRIREHFLVRIFTLARFREAAHKGTTGALADFHERHELLLMAYNQRELKEMRRLARSPHRESSEELFSAYGERLRRALARPPRHAGNLKVLTHAMGYFANVLTSGERGRFLDALRHYEEKRIPLSIPVSIMSSWIDRYGQRRLAAQVYFRPYPQELALIGEPRQEVYPHRR